MVGCVCEEEWAVKGESGKEQWRRVLNAESQFSASLSTELAHGGAGSAHTGLYRWLIIALIELTSCLLHTS